MSNKIFNKLTNQLNETIQSSLSLALHNKNQEVEIIHIIWALLTNTNSILNQQLNKLNIDKSAIELEAKSYASKLPQVSSVTKENIVISRNLIGALEKAEGLMATTGDSFIALDTFIISNLSNVIFKDILGKYLDLNEFKKNLETMRGGNTVDSANADENFEALEKYGINLNQKSLAAQTRSESPVFSIVFFLISVKFRSQILIAQAFVCIINIVEINQIIISNFIIIFFIILF